jgi:hypothetical protein
MKNMQRLNIEYTVVFFHPHTPNTLLHEYTVTTICFSLMKLDKKLLYTMDVRHAVMCLLLVLVLHRSPTVVAGPSFSPSHRL